MMSHRGQGRTVLSEPTLANASCYIVAGVAATVVLALLLMDARDRWSKEGTRRAKIAVVVVLVAIVVVIASTAILSLMVEEERSRYDYVYTATLTCGDLGGVVRLPVSVNETLQERIRVTSGKGTAYLVGTEHGPALEVVFRGNVTVEGLISGDSSVHDWEPTMLDWSYGHVAWVWLGLEEGNGSVGLVLMLDERLIPGHDSSYYIRADLRTGWNTYVIRHVQE